MIKHAHEFLPQARTEADAAARASHRGTRATLQSAGARVAMRDGAAESEVEETPVVSAYINHERWVADCPCGAGMAVDGGWAFAYCLGCGRKARVQWPDGATRAAVEDLLAGRPTRFANWHPSEELAALEAENHDHGHRTGA